MSYALIFGLLFVAGAYGRNPVCDLPSETGPCRGFFLKYYFDKDTGKCQEFVYGGCKGNANSFWTEEDCQAFCSEEGSELENDVTPLKKEDGSELGNDVTILKKREVEAEESLVERPSFCYLPPVTGRCLAYFRNYYFNPSTESCEEFVYGGCEGNENNFRSEVDCINTCGKSA